MEKKGYYVHPTCLVDEKCKIGDGTRIWHWSHIMHDVEIGQGCNIGEHAFVENGVKLGNHVKVKNNVALYTGVTCEDDVFLGPNCVFTNVVNPRSFIERKSEFRPTLVKRGASIGANATIVCGNSIGRYAFVGAGSVVTRPVPDYVMVVGNPAKFFSYVCMCGNKLSEDFSCPACGKRYEKTDAGLVEKQ